MKRIKLYIYQLEDNIRYFSRRFANPVKIVSQVYKERMGYELNLEAPQTYNEKLQWMKLFYHNPLYTTLVDKYSVKQYVEERIGKEYLIPTIGVWDRFDDIDFEKLPQQFVLKCTHDSGGLVICKDKSKLDVQKARETITKCLKHNFYYSGFEWPYKNVKPRIIAEKYMVDESGTELKDYKFFCFDGVPKFVQMDYDRFCGHKRNMYDINWNRLPFSLEFPTDLEREFAKPKGLDMMIDIATRLSKGFPHVRVDLYNVDVRVYFGEMTFFHGSGFEHFDPEEWDLKFGKEIKLPSKLV